MKLFKKIGEYLIEVDKKELTKQEGEISSNRPLKETNDLKLSKQEYLLIKQAFQNTALDLANELKENQKEPEKILKAVIPPEFLESIKTGENKLMQGDGGIIYPTIVGSNNKILKKITLEEFEITPEEANAVGHLNNKIMNQKLDALAEQLHNLVEIADEINKGLRNDRYGRVNGALRTIRQSYLEDDEEYKKQLQYNSQGKLNESIEVLSKEIEDGLEYFNEWELRSKLTNEYSVKTITKKFNKLMEDYLFFTGAKSALIELKQAQGMGGNKLLELTEDLDKIDGLFKKMKMDDWLAPVTQKNSWQHQLFDAINTTNNQIVIEYDIEELLQGERS